MSDYCTRGQILSFVLSCIKPSVIIVKNRRYACLGAKYKQICLYDEKVLYCKANKRYQPRV